MSNHKGATALILLLVCCILISVVVGAVVEDPYKSLGISKSASQDEIKRAYKALALKWHPDKNENSVEAQEKFVEITTAYEILTDDEKRRQFENAKNGGGYQQRGAYDPFGFNYFFQNVKPIFSDTFSLTYDNFDLMVNDEDIWAIEFYTDRCQPCIENSPIWDQSAKSLSEFVKFGRINADEQAMLLRHFRVRNIPSVIAIVDGSTHYFLGRFEVGAITDFVKRLQPSSVFQINSKRDWETFKFTRNNKPLALLFSSHSPTISPLYKYISHKYSHLYNFAQIMTDALDRELAALFGVAERPTIVFFPSQLQSTNSVDERIVVPGPFTKQSLTTIVEEHKYLGAPEFTINNFVHFCGRKSASYCGIVLTTPTSKYFTKHILSLRQLSDSNLKLGWVDSLKFGHFLDFFSIFNLFGEQKLFDEVQYISFTDKEQLQGMIILDGAKRKYTLLRDEIDSPKLVKWTEEAKLGRVKFSELPRYIPPLTELSSASVFNFDWLYTVFLMPSTFLI